MIRTWLPLNNSNSYCKTAVVIRPPLKVPPFQKNRMKCLRSTTTGCHLSQEIWCHCSSQTKCSLEFSQPRQLTLAHCLSLRLGLWTTTGRLPTCSTEKAVTTPTMCKKAALNRSDSPRSTPASKKSQKSRRSSRGAPLAKHSLSTKSTTPLVAPPKWWTITLEEGEEALRCSLTATHRR